MPVLTMPGLPKHYEVGTQQRLCKVPHTIAKGPLLLPRMTASEDKSIKPKLLTSLACNAHKIITSKSPDFKNPTLLQTLEMLQCTKQSKHYQAKRISYSIGKILPPGFCPWE